MEPIVWEESFSVGVRDLDDEHQQIIRMVNKLIEAQDAGVRSEAVSDVLTEMTRFANEHFEREERYMMEYGYPGLAAHREVHRNFRKKTVSLCMDAIAWKSAVPAEILEFLVEWWTGHILKEDMRYKKFFQERGLAEA